MKDLFTDYQLDLMSVVRQCGLDLFYICFSLVKLLKDIVKDPTESLEDSGCSCFFKGESVSEPSQTLWFNSACH